MNTADIPDADVNAITRYALQFALYREGGAGGAASRVAIAEANQTEEWKLHRKLTIQVLAGLSMCGYTVEKEAA